MKDDASAIELIKQNRVFSVSELSQWLGCSLPTCRRRLKQWQAYTSCNHNGRYYTLPSIARFDAEGFWHYRDILFSRHGNLRQTVVHFIHSSSGGLSAADLSKILQMDALSFLSHFQDIPELYRQKIEGRYIWFAADFNIRKRQKRERENFKRQVSVAMLSAEKGLRILVDLLHHPGSTIKNICRRLKRTHGLSLTEDTVRAFLESHDLLKKTAEPSLSDG